MKLKSLAFAVGIAASAFALPAMAAVQTYTIGAFAPSVVDFSSVQTLQQFDSSLGTLNSITISYAADVTGTAWLSNTKTSNKVASLALDAALQLSVDNGAVLGSNSATLISGNYNAAGKSTAVQVDEVTKTLTITSSVNNTLFSFFTGNGTVDGTFALSAVSNAESPSGITADFLTKAQGLGGTITYDYTVAAVPEPETYGMLLLGLGVVAFAAKRKARSAKA